MQTHRVLLPVLAALSLVALAGCVAQNTAPLPPNIEIVKPGLAIPESQAAFVGKWEGSWDGRLETRLVVERVIPGANQAEIIYAWGQIGTVMPDFSRHVASFDGATLKFSTALPASYEFRLRADGKLDGRYEWNGGFSKGVFVRSKETAQ